LRQTGDAEEESQADAQAETWPYFIHEGGMWMHQTAGDGTPKVPLLLTNFTAAITGETSKDDGEHTEDYYTITATCGKRRRTIDMLTTDFEGDAALGRIVAALGARARVNPKAQARYVLDAIKALSTRIEEQTIYTHTGWVQGRYLFSNGYIDAAGWHPATGDTATWCHLPNRLERYRLHPTGSMAEALDLFDCLLDLAPSSVMVPLVGGILLAPIAHALDAPAPMIHVYGPTGSHKTSICCAAMALLGDFTPAHPTDTWTSTANSVQRLGWHLKDAPMLLDDYKAANVKPNQVTFLLQNYGDGMARGRLDANSEARAAYPIRGVLISSGEDQPEGEASILARILSVSLARGGVHRAHLTSIQRNSHALHPLITHYLQWLAAGEQGTLPQRHQETRNTILAKLEQNDHATNPGRVASNVASIFVAWETFMDFLRVQALWESNRVDAWCITCKRELITLARQQLDLTTGERYSVLFIEQVKSLLASGKAYLLDMEADGQHEMALSQVLIGAKDRNGLYLMAQTSYDEVSKHMRSTGKNPGFSQRALSQLLSQDGLLLNTQGNSLLVRKRINGVCAWCWHLPRGVFEDL
jgi:hypothetical protein